MDTGFLEKRLLVLKKNREALAAESGWSFSTISNMLAGKRVSLGVAEDVARVLECKVSDFAPELVTVEAPPLAVGTYSK